MSRKLLSRCAPPTQYPGQQTLASFVFRISWPMETRFPFLPVWKICCPFPYLMPGLCWVWALAQGWEVLGHPPEGLARAQEALWL